MSNLRPSKLPKGRLCSASLSMEADAEKYLKLPIDTTNEPAKLGSALHELAARDSTGDLVDQDIVDATAKEYGVPRRELTWLWSRVDTEHHGGRPDKTWIEHTVSMWFPENVTVKGTLDRALYFEADGELFVDDWKSGRLAVTEEPEAAEHDQIQFYGVGLWDELTNQGIELETLTMRIFPIRIGMNPSVHSVDAKGVEELRAGLTGLVRKLRGQSKLPFNERSYTVGAHCRWCRGRGLCMAYHESMVQGFALLSPPAINEEELPKTKAGTPNKKALAAAQRRIIEERVSAVIRDDPTRAFAHRSLAGQLKEALEKGLKEYVEFFGSIPCDDGTVLEFRDYQTKGTLSLEAIREACAWLELEPSVADRLTDALANRPSVPSKRFGKYRPR